MNEPPLHREPRMFAPYEPRNEGTRWRAGGEFVVRPSVCADRQALAEIAWMRNGGELAHYIQRFERDLANHGQPPDDLWLTALVGARPVGYGKVAHITPAADAPPNHAPAGFYLGGVSVHPDLRRRGIAAELTRVRLQWIRQRSGTAFYFVNAQNRASIDLHAAFGFVELTRDFFIPGASFVGGVGILFRADLSVRG